MDKCQCNSSMVSLISRSLSTTKEKRATMLKDRGFEQTHAKKLRKAEILEQHILFRSSSLRNISHISLKLMNFKW